MNNESDLTLNQNLNPQADHDPLPSDPGPHKVSVKDHLQELFELDVRAAQSEPALLPLDTPEELLKFLTVDHESDTYIWNSRERELTGFISLVNREDDSTMEVLNLEIDPKFHRQGYGRHMMEFAEQVARQTGKDKLWLVTSPKNLRAVQFYQSNGYTIVDEIENYFGNGESRYRLEKPLKMEKQ